MCPVGSQLLVWCAVVVVRVVGCFFFDCRCERVLVVLYTVTQLPSFLLISAVTEHPLFLLMLAVAEHPLFLLMLAAAEHPLYLLMLVLLTYHPSFLFI